MKKQYIIVLALILITSSYFIYSSVQNSSPHPIYKFGDVVDSLNGVYVYYNGRVSHTGERNTTKDGYNIGLKYQCVEFVKRYYYEYYRHKMPDTYGNARDFFDAKVNDGELNTARNLLQFSNHSKLKPKVGDLIILDGHWGNKYGHVAIVCSATQSNISIIQQNPGVFDKSRVEMELDSANSKFEVKNSMVLGWLRKK